MAQDIIDYIAEWSIAEAVCLAVQILITIQTFKNLQRNQTQFPVKQLSPILSLVALISFLLLNLISLSAKIIQEEQQYYNPSYQSSQCGQCRLYQHVLMMILAFLYNGLRELPLILFLLKTFRVSICYIDHNSNEIHKTLKWLLMNQFRMLAFSIAISTILMGVGAIVFWPGTSYNGMLIFQFFCPKQSGVYDWVITSIRFLFMAYIYVLSVSTNPQLDFKRFLILIFALTNTEVILRLFLALSQINKMTYHEFYYHSFLMNLFGSMLMFFYSRIKQQRNQPLDPPILQDFNGFIQSRLGYSILVYYVGWLDSNGYKIQNSKNSYKQVFYSYLSITQIEMLSVEQAFNIKDFTNEIIKVLTNIDMLKQISTKRKFIDKCKKKQFNMQELKCVSNFLNQFCCQNIFWAWRSTQSSKYLEQQFKINSIINHKMKSLGIQL